MQRVYSKDEKGKQRVKTIEPGYKLKTGETARIHYGVDQTTRREGELHSKPMDFAAGVYGVVLKAGDGDWGTITVQLQNGSIVQYLHTSMSYVKVKDLVTPTTLLAMSGRKGADEIHIHIQAKDKDGKPIYPDDAYRAGQTKLATPVPFVNLKFVDFDPETSAVGKPTIVDGVVRAPAVGWDENAKKGFGSDLVGKWNYGGTDHFTFELKADRSVWIDRHGGEWSVGTVEFKEDRLEIVCKVPDYGTPTPLPGEPEAKYSLRRVKGKLEGSVWYAETVKHNAYQGRFSQWSEPRSITLERSK